jgi:hypothetical protein
VHFLDAWSSLPPLDLARLLLPVGALALATLAPGPVPARIAALIVTADLPFLRELGPPLVIAGWVTLWLAIAWWAGPPGPAARAGSGPSHPGVEPGAVGLLVSIALLVLLVAALARHDMDADPARRAGAAVALVGVGLAHLMVRRHVRRAAVGFGALGLGLQLLDSLARASVLGVPSASFAILLATAAAVALAIRLGAARARVAGSEWVSDAHDLHD